MSPCSSPEGTAGHVRKVLLISTNQERACPNRAGKLNYANFEIADFRVLVRITKLIEFPVILENFAIIAAGSASTIGEDMFVTQSASLGK